MPPCPPLEQLNQLLAGPTGSAEASVLAAHVRECPPCQRRLEELAHPADDTERVDRAAAVSEPHAAFAQRLTEGVRPARRTHVPAADEPPTPSGAGELEPWPEVEGFEVLEVLGRGGMGVVYKARQLDLRRVVALKMIQTGRGDATNLSRFRAEAGALARLTHPNIVQIHEVNQHAGRPYLVLEYVPGGTLRRECGPPQDPRRAAEVVRTLAGAVHFAHTQGVVHRDLKPGNVLLTRDGVPKVTDFGLAKFHAVLGDETAVMAMGVPTPSDQVLGTPQYMAPEQADGRLGAVGPRSDVYALGVILYELLTGRPPFDGPAPVEVVRQLLGEEVLSPDRLQPRLPRDLVTICLKCLEREPGRRYATAADLAEDLRRFLKREPIKARPVGYVGSLARWCRRHPARAALTAALVVSLASGLAAVTWLWRLAERHSVLAREERREAVAARHEAETNLNQARANLYFSQLAQARLEWRLNNIAEVHNLLKQCEARGEERPRWEWNYLNGLTHSDLLTLPNVHLEVTALAFSPDGRRLLAAGGNPFGDPVGEVKVLEIEGDGHGGHVLRGHRHLVTDAAFSPDGRLVASAGMDNTVRLWDAGTGKELRAFTGHTHWVDRVAFAPDGGLLASADVASNVRVWDVRTGEAVRTLPGRGVGFSPDGRALAVCSGAGTQFWGPRTGEKLREIAAPGTRLAFSPGGRLLAVGSDGGLAVQVFDAVTGAPLCALAGHSGPVMGLAFGPDGRSLATASADGAARVWDARSGVLQRVLRGHTGRVACVGFHPCGRFLVSGGHQPGDVKLWDLTGPQEYVSAAAPEGAEEIEALAFAAEGSQVVVVRRGGQVRAHDAGSGVKLRECAVALTAEWLVPAATAALTADGRLLAAVGATAPREVTLWEADTGKEVRRLAAHAARVFHLAFSRDGNRLASMSLAYTQDGSSARELRVWDADTGRLLRDWRPGGVTAPGSRRSIYGALALSPDGRSVAFDDYAGGEGGQTRSRARVCEVGSGDELLSLEGLTGQVSGLRFSGDGRRLVLVSASGRVMVYETADGRPLYAAPLQGPPHGPGEAAFSPDGRLLAAADREQVKVWEVESGRDVMVLRGAPPRTKDGGFNPKVVWSDDGRRLAASNWDFTVSVWDGSERGTPAAKESLRRAADDRAPDWHRRQAEACRNDRDAFGLAFHERLLMTTRARRAATMPPRPEDEGR